MRWLLMGLLLMLAAPVRVIADVWHSAMTDVHARIYLWGLRSDLRLRILTENQHRRYFFIDSSGRAHPVHARPGQVRRSVSMLRTLLRSDRLRRMLLRHIDLQALHVAVRLGLSSAARTAMLTGVVQVLQRMLPPRLRRRVRIAAQPDFLHEETLTQARCIVFFHLGILLVAAAMALIAYWLERWQQARHPQTVKEAET